MRGTLYDFTFFTRRERRKTLLLIGLLLLVAALSYLWPRLTQDPDDGQEDEVTEQMRQEYADFLQGMELVESQQRSGDVLSENAYELFPFDPNRIDSVGMRRLGLPAWMARNLLRYRTRGGVFRRPDDFRKLYGLTDEQFARLRPYISIAPIVTQEEGMPRSASAEPPVLYQPDTAARYVERPAKYPTGTLVSLNQADTTELQRIPGIGSYIARIITEYRDRLGGFYSVEQLRDIGLKSELLCDWFVIDTTDIKRLNINQASIRTLSRHPYLNYRQAKALVELRHRNGPFHNLKPLRLLEEFTEEELERLSHYVCYE